jgi:hypothetical protein
VVKVHLVPFGLFMGVRYLKQEILTAGGETWCGPALGNPRNRVDRNWRRYDGLSLESIAEQLWARPYDDVIVTRDGYRCILWDTRGLTLGSNGWRLAYQLSEQEGRITIDRILVAPDRPWFSRTPIVTDSPT